MRWLGRWISHHSSPSRLLVTFALECVCVCVGVVVWDWVCVCVCVGVVVWDWVCVCVCVGVVVWILVRVHGVHGGRVGYMATVGGHATLEEHLPKGLLFSTRNIIIIRERDQNNFMIVPIILIHV